MLKDIRSIWAVLGIVNKNKTKKQKREEKKEKKQLSRTEYLQQVMWNGIVGNRLYAIRTIVNTAITFDDSRIQRERERERGRETETTIINHAEDNISFLSEQLVEPTTEQNKTKQNKSRKRSKQRKQPL